VGGIHALPAIAGKRILFYSGGETTESLRQLRDDPVTAARLFRGDWVRAPLSKNESRRISVWEWMASGGGKRLRKGQA
jgi:hypothetical protein